jgi:hypothetical protein
MPAVQPRVLFQNGLLSIDAPNSTMTDVLNAVHRQTGAKIDVPAGAGGDRIVARLGPGQPRDVLASLLSGSKFDYIILGPPQNPAGVQRVILSRRQAGAAAAPSENAGQPTFQPQVIPPPEDAESGDEVEPELPEEAPPQPETAAPTLQPGQDPNQQQQGQQGQGQGQNSNQPKSPEQLLQELQRMQQQQQQPDPNQQPQQQPSPDRNPPDEQ